MEKTKYIVKGLGAFLAGAGLIVALGYGLITIGKALGLEAEHITGGVVMIIAVGMIVFWLSEDYEMKKRHKSLNKQELQCKVWKECAKHKARRLAVKGNGKPKSLLDIQGGPGRR